MQINQEAGIVILQQDRAHLWIPHPTSGASVSIDRKASDLEYPMDRRSPTEVFRNLPHLLTLVGRELVGPFSDPESRTLLSHYSLATA